MSHVRYVVPPFSATRRVTACAFLNSKPTDEWNPSLIPNDPRLSRSARPKITAWLQSRIHCKRKQCTNTRRTFSRNDKFSALAPSSWTWPYICISPVLSNSLPRLKRGYRFGYRTAGKVRERRRTEIDTATKTIPVVGYDMSSTTPLALRRERESRTPCNLLSHWRCNKILVGASESASLASQVFF